MSFCLYYPTATVGIRDEDPNHAAKKNLQAILEKHNDGFRAMMTEFQQSLSNTMRNTMEFAVRTLVQAQQNTAPELQRQEDPLFDDVEEEEEDNVFVNQFAPPAK